MIDVNYLEKVAYEKYAANVITSIIKNVGKPIGGALARIPISLGISSIGRHLGESARIGAGLELAGNTLGSAIANTGTKKTLPKKITHTIAKAGKGLKNFFGYVSNEANTLAKETGVPALTTITHNLSPKNYKIIKSKGLISDSLTGSELSFTGRKANFSDMVRQEVLDEHRGNVRQANFGHIGHPANLSRNAGINTPEMRKERQNIVKKFLLRQRARRIAPAIDRADPADMIATYKAIKRHGKLNPIFDAQYNGNKVLDASPGFKVLGEKHKLVTVPGTYKIEDRSNTFFDKLENTIDNIYTGSQGNRNFSEAIYGRDPRVFLKPQAPQVTKSTTTPKMQQPHPPVGKNERTLNKTTKNKTTKTNKF